MKTYIAQRLGIGLVTLFGMSVVIFLLLRLAPGNIVDILFSTGGYVNPSERAAIERELGLDKPLWAQYVEWMRQLAVGNLGKSYRYDLPAWEIIRPLIPVTLELALLSLIISVALGVPLGVISAVRQDTRLDYVLRVFSLAGLSMPSFWLGMVIILGLVAWIGWIPPVTYVRMSENFWLHAVQFMLPALAVGYRSSALIMRITRSSLLEVLREDYVRTAWAKGQTRRAVIWRHALKNAILPVVTVIGIEFAFLIGGLVGHGDGVQPARPRPLPRAGHPLARLPHRAEPGHVHRGRRHPVESPRRHALRRPRPAGAVWQLIRSAPARPRCCRPGEPGPAPGRRSSGSAGKSRSVRRAGSSCS